MNRRISRKRLAAIQRKLAKLRDELRARESELADLLSAAETIHGGACDALESLDYAIDRLSEQQ